MTARFQHLAVQSGIGPHTTVIAGVEMANRSWSTTSTSAVKVGMLRRRPRAGVLNAVGVSHGCALPEWTLSVGRTTVLDPRRPLDALADPTAASIAGIAVARIGLNYLDQLAGYLDDGSAIPESWRPAARVLVVVQHDHRLRWNAERIIEWTGAFAAASAIERSPRGRRRTEHSPDRSSLTMRQRALLDVDGPCVVGLETTLGPAAVPGWWDPTGETVSVDLELLAHLGATLPGRCSVTFDQSDDSRPSAKVGVMLRGETIVLGDSARGDRGPSARATALLAIRTQRVTAWDGFESASQLAS
ncbi:MAG: hypothetical protein ABIR32_14285 [Ilumatobacteraceae bacterium]